MPHKCTKCGREYKDGATEILKGCESCGGKKFLYVKEEELHKDVLEEKTIEEIAEESHEEVLEVIEPHQKKPVPEALPHAHPAAAVALADAAAIEANLGLE